MAKSNLFTSVILSDRIVIQLVKSDVGEGLQKKVNSSGLCTVTLGLSISLHSLGK